MTGPNRNGRRTSRLPLRDDDRGVSIAITHGLTIAITGVLLIGLVAASGSVLETHEQRVSDTQLREIEGDLVSQIHTVDRLSQRGTNVSTNVTLRYPERIVDAYSYRVSLSGDGDPAVVEVRVPQLDRVVSSEIDTQAGIDPASENGPSITVALCSGNITVGGCE